MQPKLLKLVPYHDQGLRKKTTPVRFPLSNEDQQTITDMLYSIQPAQLLAANAPFEGAAGMAANQWGIDKSIFLFCPEGNNNQIEVIINPSYEVLDQTQDEEWEGCFSVPGISGKVKRYLKVKVQYQDQNGEWLSKELSGWDARVWQHENDHLNGFLFDDEAAGKCVEKAQINSKPDLEELREQNKKERS